MKHLIFIFDNSSKMIYLSHAHKDEPKENLLNLHNLLKAFNTPFLVFDGSKMDINNYLDTYGDDTRKVCCAIENMYDEDEFFLRVYINVHDCDLIEMKFISINLKFNV